MKTVGDFKKAGLVFVEGDKGDDFHVNNEGIFNNTMVFRRSVPTGFTWRTNIGVKPEFYGKIDFIHRDGSEFFGQVIGTEMCQDWTMDGHSADIIKWRPHLPAQESTLNNTDVTDKYTGSLKDAYSMLQSQSETLKIKANLAKAFSNMKPSAEEAAELLKKLGQIQTETPEEKEAFEHIEMMQACKVSSKYDRDITDRQGNSACVDVYDVLKAFEVNCPATQHAIKKLLCSGLRGRKDAAQDLLEAKESITRAIELGE